MPLGLPSLRLPAPVAVFFDAVNRHDVNAVAAAFTPDGIVNDEGEDYLGPLAIRLWAEETALKYAMTIRPDAAETVEERIVVQGEVIGNFPGSPAVLTFAFTLNGEAVTRLTIG